MSLWTWPEGDCDIDKFMIRKAFWSADQAVLTPGQPVNFSFDMAGAKPEPASVYYSILDAGGAVLKADKFAGQTPLKQQVAFSPPGVGYYTLKSVAATPGGAFQDELGVCVINPIDGLAAVKRLWTKQK